MRTQGLGRAACGGRAGGSGRWWGRAVGGGGTSPARLRKRPSSSAEKSVSVIRPPAPEICRRRRARAGKPWGRGDAAQGGIGARARARRGARGCNDRPCSGKAARCGHGAAWLFAVRYGPKRSAAARAGRAHLGDADHLDVRDLLAAAAPPPRRRRAHQGRLRSRRGAARGGGSQWRGCRASRPVPAPARRRRPSGPWGGRGRRRPRWRRRRPGPTPPPLPARHGASRRVTARTRRMTPKSASPQKSTASAAEREACAS